MIDCLQTLVAPGTPLVVRTQGRGGLVTLRAETYAYDFWTGGIVGRNVSVVSPTHISVARAESIHIRLPRAYRGPRPSLDVSIKNLEATIERDAQGKWSVLDLLPEPAEEPSTQPFQVDVDNASLLLIDRTGGQVWSRQVQIPRIAVDGIGESWSAHGTLNWSSGGRVQLHARSEASGYLTINGSADRLEAQSFLPPLKRTESVRESGLLESFEASALETSGKFWVRFEEEAPVRFSANVSASGRDVRYDEYRAKSARFEGRLDESGAKGVLHAADTGLTAMFAGHADWNEAVTGFGRLTFQAASRSAIPKFLGVEIPEDVTFTDLAFDGSASIRDTDRYLLQGEVRAEEITYQGEIVRNARALTMVSPGRIALRRTKATYDEHPLQGALDLDIDNRTLLGYFEAESVHIEDFRSRLGTDRLFGVFSAEATVRGTFDRPLAQVRAKGELSAMIEPDRVVELGPFHALAFVDGRQVRIDQLALAGLAGAASASGTLDLESRVLDFEVLTSGIDLADIHSQLSGTAIGRFEIGGTLDKYTVNGPVELYGLEVQGQAVPLILADLSADANGLRAERIRASRGAGRLRGEAAWTFADGRLTGEFDAEGLQLHDFVDDSIEGTLNVSNGRLGGTIESPILEANLGAQDFVVRQIRVDSASGRVKYESNQVELFGGTVQMQDGVVSASGAYDFATGNGEIRGDARQIDLAGFQPLLPKDWTVAGHVSGGYRAGWGNSVLASARFDGGLEWVAVNGTSLGSGPVTVDSDGDTWNGNAMVGQLERFVELEDIRYRPDNGTVDGRLTVFDAPLEDVVRGMRPLMEAPSGAPNDLYGQLTGLKGRVDLSAEVSGAWDDPGITIETLLVRDTTLNGDATGTIEAAGTRQENGAWSVQKLRWTGGPGILDITGTFAEQGAIALDGNLNNFNTQWLAQFVPQMAKLTGEASLFFSVTGQTENPLIEASLSGSFFEVGAATDNPDLRLNMELYPILISNREISVDGLFRYRGFAGELSGKVPFRFPASIPDNETIDLQLKIQPRELKELKDLVQEIDAENTSGQFSADLRLTGTKESLDILGSVEVNAESLYFTNTDYDVRNLQLRGDFGPDGFRLGLRGEPVPGGLVTSNINVPIQNLSDTFTAIGDALSSNSFDELIDQRLTGNVTFKDLIVRAEDREFGGEVATKANGRLNLTGTIRRPTISTFVPIALENVRGVVPSGFESGTSEELPVIRPDFRIAYIIGTQRDPADVSATSSQLSLYGSGTLTGRLPNVRADATLKLSSGTIRLPNARIQLLEGGTVRALYDATSIAEPNLRLDVDIEGRTSLSTLRFTNLVERYDIFLEIRGNLLNTEEQLITARSDPPDLTSERILSLLGQVELFTSLSNQVTGDPNRTELERTLAGLALPVVFDPLTEELARQFGLEYLSVNYGPLGQTDVTLAKWLGKGFTIQGRREISDPVDGIYDYDIRLTYRPPRSIRTLRDLVFSIGTDQERPWKISVEYGKRFRSGGDSGSSSIKWIGRPPANRG